MHVINFWLHAALCYAGMLCALTAAAFWLLFATYCELPVSTTHSIGELAQPAHSLYQASVYHIPQMCTVIN